MLDSAASSPEKNCEVSLTEQKHECPVSTAIEVIGGKWKVIILYQLRGKTLRFGELKREIPKITQKTLTQQLRDLEKDKLIERKVFAEVPPRVEYTPTALAEQLNPALDLLCDWGKAYQKAHE
ncbi:transcriptional regulator [Agarivorans sp. OAG1]|uniref:Transcriptional regulator n=1 Tax=Agarivorans albus MKT 106 TaxID=1331007 RepID=R9PNM2_AGAAL|nr:MULTISPECIES: helix-turn-helix domain-containing protein [Agarivorans]BEU04029.1 transcriptional regulator [Agarivorans sp. OAG1]GAD02997.1 transcriptional regulator [Agarivorans albus MKT 106]